MRREPRRHEASRILTDIAGAVAVPTLEPIRLRWTESVMTAQRRSKCRSFFRLIGWDKRP